METLVQSAVVAVIISSLVTIAGWYATHQSERRLEAARRRERIQDIQTALLADICSTSNRFQAVDPDQHLAQVVTLLRSAPADPGSRRSFNASRAASCGRRSQRTFIRTDVIESVVLFFSEVETIRFFVDGLRSDWYAQLEPDAAGRSACSLLFRLI